MKSVIKKIRNFFYQSQEFTLWLPGLVLLAVLGWVVIGGIVRVGPDAMAWLIELPVWCAWAAAWLGASWAIKVLYLHDIPRELEGELEDRILDGDSAARWLLVKDRLETLGCLLLTLIFFWPAR